MTAIRHVEVDQEAPLREWPAEAIETLVDRGGLSDWRRLAAEIRRSPWGRVARMVETVVSWAEHPGLDDVLGSIVDRARAEVTEAGRRRWADEVRSLRARTGLSMREFAALAGTSASRLSDYENGRVAPTTDTLARLEHAAAVAVSA